MDLEGKVAVVTGASSGIGRATAIAFGRAGCDVLIADIDEERAHDTAGQITTRTHVLRVDVTNHDDIETFVSSAIAWQGRCDVFMSNVGVGCSGAPQDFTHNEWEYLLAVNLWSAIWPLRTIVPHMLERGSGRLVFVSSGAGFEGVEDRAPYNVAKFGLVGLAESIDRYLEDTDVGVTLVVPGAIATDGWRRYRIAGADALDPADIERQRAEQREHSSEWPRPGVMADAIVDGLRNDRFMVVQHNPYDPDWLKNAFEKKLQR